jgi:hypothetical protein
MAEETTKKDNIDINDPFSNKGMFAIDKGLGGIMGANQPKGVDTTDIDKTIAGLEKPASGSVYDKLAARYRSQGAGAVLRTQKNLANLFLPTVNLIQEREAQALARYTLLKQKLEDFDDSTIFGQADGSEMPIVDEIKSLANMTKEDMRELSRLNPADERYDVLAKKIQKNNEAIANFDEINQKLLEIRNSQDGSADASQWSKGMTQTERDMWMDIYTGKGNNIKIQDGKLVWTDTRGETKYDKFKGGDFEDDKYEALKGSNLGELAYWSRDDDGKQITFNNGDKGNEVEFTQKYLNKGGFTDADGNKLKEDGVWGPKSQAAYDKYLAKKDELETAYFNENLSEEDKQKYGSIVEGSVGRTRVIDLNNISSGPTMIENAATITERKIQGGVQDLINSGVDINDPNYQRTVKSMIYQLNQTGPAGIKSLIFDGLNTDDDDIFTSENTNSFIEGVIANNAEEFGIKDPENMTEQELESAIEKLKEGDVTIQYNNSEGKKESLQRQYLHWYKSQIDAKVEAGVKSKFSSTTGELTSDKNKNKNKNKNNNQTTTTTTTTSTTTDNEIDTTVADNFTGRFGTDIDQMFSELTTEDSTYVGGGGNDGTTSGLLFNYGDNEFVENTLNRTYGVSAEEFGDVTSSGQDAEGARMSFHFEALDYLSGGFGDRLDVYYRDFNGTVHKKRFEFDNTGDTDLEQSQALQQWMRGKIRDDQRFVKGITSSNAKKYVPKDTSGGGSYDPNENTTQTSSTTSSTTNTSTTSASNTTGTFRDTMSSDDQNLVNKFSVDGKGRANFAKILKDGEAIQVDIQGKPAKVTGVKAVGNELFVIVESDIGIGGGDYDLGKFVKDGNGFKFVKNNENYRHLEGDEKREFDAFIAAIESDPNFANEVNNAVTRTDTIFETKNY